MAVTARGRSTSGDSARAARAATVRGRGELEVPFLFRFFFFFLLFLFFFFFPSRFLLNRPPKVDFSLNRPPTVAFWQYRLVATDPRTDQLPDWYIPGSTGPYRLISPFSRPKQSLAWNQQEQGKSLTHDAADDAADGAVVPDVLPSYLLRRRKPQRLYLRLLLHLGGFPGLSISVSHAPSSPLDCGVESKTKGMEKARSLRDRQSQARRALHER
ncbi:hypothetical protein GW17_00030201 [Ensete ventricosum]|nr:hypothetical protein GW17_00030201 [Ensete ventricosum]